MTSGPQINGVVRTRFVGHQNGIPAGWRLFWGTGSAYPFTDPDLAGFATQCLSSFVADVLPNFCSDFTLDEVIAEDVSVGASGIGNSSGTGGSGGGTPPMPASASVLLAFAIPSRYRGGHPRCYLPPMGRNSMASSQEWNNADVDLVSSGFVTFVSDVVTSAAASILGITHHVAVRHDASLTPPWKAFTVQNYSGRYRIASQRRRIAR